MWNYASSTRERQLVQPAGTAVDARCPRARLGQTHGGSASTGDRCPPASPTGVVVSPDANGGRHVIGDPDPAYDDCSDSTTLDELAAQDVGHPTSVTAQPGERDLGLVPGRFQAHRALRRLGHLRQVRLPRTRTSAAPRWSTTARTTRRSSTTSDVEPAPPAAVVGLVDRAHRPGNHNYDRSDFSAAGAPATCRLSASSRRRSTRTGTPPTPTRSTSSTSWSRVNELQRRGLVLHAWFGCTTTPTAGNTTRRNRC